MSSQRNNPNDSNILTGLLDFYSDKAGDHASFMVATIFGLYTLLAIITAIKLDNNYSLGKIESIFMVLSYGLLFILGTYSLMNFKFYSGLAQDIRNKMTPIDYEQIYTNWLWRRDTVFPIRWLDKLFLCMKYKRKKKKRNNEESNDDDNEEESFVARTSIKIGVGFIIYMIVGILPLIIIFYFI